MEKDYWGNLRVLEIDKSREKIKAEIKAEIKGSEYLKLNLANKEKIGSEK